MILLKEMLLSRQLLLDPAFCYNKEQNLIYVSDAASLLSKLFGKLKVPASCQHVQRHCK